MPPQYPRPGGTGRPGAYYSNSNTYATTETTTATHPPPSILAVAAMASAAAAEARGLAVRGGADNPDVQFSVDAEDAVPLAQFPPDLLPFLRVGLGARPLPESPFDPVERDAILQSPLALKKWGVDGCTDLLATLDRVVEANGANVGQLDKLEAEVRLIEFMSTAAQGLVDVTRKEKRQAERLRRHQEQQNAAPLSAPPPPPLPPEKSYVDDKYAEVSVVFRAMRMWITLEPPQEARAPARAGALDMTGPLPWPLDGDPRRDGGFGAIPPAEVEPELFKFLGRGAKALVSAHASLMSLVPLDHLCPHVPPQTLLHTPCSDPPLLELTQLQHGAAYYALRLSRWLRVARRWCLMRGMSATQEMKGALAELAGLVLELLKGAKPLARKHALLALRGECENENAATNGNSEARLLRWIRESFDLRYMLGQLAIDVAWIARWVAEDETGGGGVGGVGVGVGGGNNKAADATGNNNTNANTNATQPVLDLLQALASASLICCVDLPPPLPEQEQDSDSDEAVCARVSGAFGVAGTACASSASAPQDPTVRLAAATLAQAMRVLHAKAYPEHEREAKIALESTLDSATPSCAPRLVGGLAARALLGTVRLRRTAAAAVNGGGGGGGGGGSNAAASSLAPFAATALAALHRVVAWPYFTVDHPLKAPGGLLWFGFTRLNAAAAAHHAGELLLSAPSSSPARSSSSAAAAASSSSLSSSAAPLVLLPPTDLDSLVRALATSAMAAVARDDPLLRSSAFLPPRLLFSESECAVLARAVKGGDEGGGGDGDKNDATSSDPHFWRRLDERVVLSRKGLLESTAKPWPALVTGAGGPGAGAGGAVVAVTATAATLSPRPHLVDVVAACCRLVDAWQLARLAHILAVVCCSSSSPSSSSSSSSPSSPSSSTPALIPLATKARATTLPALALPLTLVLRALPPQTANCRDLYAATMALGGVPDHHLGLGRKLGLAHMMTTRLAPAAIAVDQALCRLKAEALGVEWSAHRGSDAELARLAEAVTPNSVELQERGGPLLVLIEALAKADEEERRKGGNRGRSRGGKNGGGGDDVPPSALSVVRLGHAIRSLAGGAEEVIVLSEVWEEAEDRRHNESRFRPKHPVRRSCANPRCPNQGLVGTMCKHGVAWGRCGAKAAAGSGFACPRAPPSLRRCGKCNVTPYCSTECQATCWPRHKLLCKVLVLTAKEG